MTNTKPTLLRPDHIATGHDRTQQGMHISVEEITPEMAERYLAANHYKNRPISKSVVRRYVDDMVNGRFQTTHQGIAFNQSGALVDGQHRLTAIMQSGVPVTMVVARGVQTDDVMGLHVDIGKARSAADIHHKSKKATAVCAFLAFVDIGSHVPKTQMHRYIAAFSADAEKIVAHVHNNIRTIAGAQVSAAALVMGGMNGALDHSCQVMSVLSKLDFNAMTPLQQAFIRAAQSGSVSARGGKWDLFEKSLALFDPALSCRTKVSASDARTEKARKYIRSVMREHDQKGATS